MWHWGRHKAAAWAIRQKSWKKKNYIFSLSFLLVFLWFQDKSTFRMFCSKMSLMCSLPLHRSLIKSFLLFSFFSLIFSFLFSSLLSFLFFPLSTVPFRAGSGERPARPLGGGTEQDHSHVLWAGAPPAHTELRPHLNRHPKIPRPRQMTWGGRGGWWGCG